jgi:MerR family transcriptional regulator/heat shock protein HspR
MDALDDERGVYSISIAAELVGTGVHNLRVYEARGLLTPSRSDGGTRRYSRNDIALLREIGHLLTAGLNLAGIEAVLGLRAELAEARRERDRLRAVLTDERRRRLRSGQNTDEPTHPRRDFR